MRETKEDPRFPVSFLFRKIKRLGAGLNLVAGSLFKF